MTGRINKKEQTGGQGSVRLLELDVFRGIAALFVVLFHYTERYGQLYGHPHTLAFSVSMGYYGVHLFFIISGFVIFLTLEKTKKPIDFVVSRMSRLYPAYWTAIAVSYLFITLFSLPGREISIGHAVVNLSMMQSWFRIHNVDGVYWSLAIELKFYILMLCLFTGSWLKRINTVAAIWLGLIVTDALLHKILGMRLPGPLRTILIFEYGSLFIAGIFFYKMKHGERGIFSHAIICVSLIPVLVENGIEKTLIVSIYYVLFYLFIHGRLAILNRKILIFIGTISYSLYLVHQNIGYIVMNRFYAHYDNTAAAILIALMVSVAIASMITYCVEKPMLKIIRQQYVNYRNHQRS